MTPTILPEDRLEGDSNFIFWKIRLLLLLDEHDLQNYVKEKITEPEGDKEKDEYKKRQAKAKRILSYTVRSHQIPHIAELKISKEMYDSLVGLFKRKNVN